MIQRFFIVIMLIGTLTALSVAQNKMTKEEWQKQITENTKTRDNLKTQLVILNKEIDSLKNYFASLEQKVKATRDETIALTGAGEENRKAFESELGKLEALVDELARLSNQDLYARKNEVDSVQAQKNNLASKKIAAMQKFHDRLQAAQSEIDGLKTTLAKTALMAEKTYTVGTWAKDRDCLWNISKKKDIYANPFMWPKIWQGNREQIKDPDIIYKGQKLKIPSSGDLTDAEKQAERQYWKKKYH